MVPLLYSGNKDLQEIQQIVTFTEEANLAKWTIWVTTDLAMIVKKKQLEKYRTKPKRNKDCFNCDKKGYYTKNYHMLNKKKLEDLLKEAKHAW